MRSVIRFVAGVVEGIHPLHQNPMRPGTLDARSHRGQAEREVADFGIARRVQDLGFTPCEDRRHQGRLGRPHGWRGQHDAAAAQPVAFGPRVNVAGLYVDVGPERVQCLEMQVDRPRADRAASRQGHARRTETGQQRRQDENAGAHAADHVVGRLRVAGCAGVQHQHPPRAAGGNHAELAHQREHGVDVRHFGNIPQLQPFGAEQRSGNLRQSRVLRPADLDRAFNASAATNDQPVHAVSLPSPECDQQSGHRLASGRARSAHHPVSKRRVMLWVFGVL